MGDRRRAGAFAIAAERVIEFPPARQRSLHAPTLHLIAHGYELLFKAILLKDGVDDKRLKKIGHNLSRIWARCELEELRTVAQRCAIDCCEEARRSGKYGGGFPDKPGEEFHHQIELLSELHSKESEFTLRYPNEIPTLIALPDSLLCILRKLIGHAQQ